MLILKIVVGVAIALYLLWRIRGGGGNIARGSFLEFWSAKEVGMKKEENRDRTGYKLIACTKAPYNTGLCRPIELFEKPDGGFVLDFFRCEGNEIIYEFSDDVADFERNGVIRRYELETVAEV